jgi:AcrR family transcriptional regulator
MGRKPIDRESLRKRVLDAAEGMIQRRGLVKSSMSDLVRASGVSRRTFYKVFRSKEDVLKGLVDRKIEGVLEMATDIVTGDVTTAEKVERLLTLVQTVTSFVTPELMRDMASAHPELWEYIHASRMRAITLWKHILMEGQRRGDIRKEIDPEIFMLVLTTIAQHMINPVFLTEHDLTMPRMIEQARLILLHGLIPHQEVTR